MTEMDMKRLNTWNSKILSRIYGPVAEQGIWIKRNSHELQDLYKDLDTAADIIKKILEWIGYPIRMDHGRVVKKIFESKQVGIRRMGRPRMKWLEGAEKEVGKMKVKRWRQKAVDREERESVIRKAKAYRET